MVESGWVVAAYYTKLQRKELTYPITKKLANRIKTGFPKRPGRVLKVEKWKGAR